MQQIFNIAKDILKEADRKYVRRNKLRTYAAQLAAIDLRQKGKHTVIEQLLNVGSGMLIAWCINLAAWWLHPYIPGFTWELSMGGSIIMTVILTLTSVLRGICWRRYFTNKFGGK